MLEYGAVLLLSYAVVVTREAALALKGLTVIGSVSVVAGRFTTIKRSVTAALADSRVRRSATALEVCLIGV